MRILKRVLWGILFVVGALVLFVVGSVAVDALASRNRVAALTNTTIEAPGGATVHTYVARPEGSGPFPAVIMIHEFWGLKPEIVGKAQALAEEGYLVIAPDLFRGQTTSWLPRAIYLALTAPEAQVLGDLDPVFAWLKDQPEVDRKRIVVMGFCYGGGKSLQFSLRNPEIAGTGIFYGALESDPALLRRLPGPVLGIFGEEDQAPSPDQVQRFQTGLDAAGIPNQVTIYPGVGHAFVTDIDSIRAGGVQGEAWNEFLTWLQNTTQG